MIYPSAPPPDPSFPSEGQLTGFLPMAFSKSLV